MCTAKTISGLAITEITTTSSNWHQSIFSFSLKCETLPSKQWNILLSAHLINNITKNEHYNEQLRKLNCIKTFVSFTANIMFVIKECNRGMVIISRIVSVQNILPSCKIHQINNFFPITKHHTTLELVVLIFLLIWVHPQI